MSLVQQISAPLQRPIKDGKRYNKLFEKVSCAVSNFGDGSNNTFEGVEFMAEWIDKYSYQTDKLAKLLIGQTVSQTVNNIYEWLYNHIQYLADGQLQQLRSPACAWSQRKKGIDCKSYTVFAMCLLKSMGLTGVIRQVRQPGEYSHLWTHVYVVVPTNQNAKNIKKELAHENYLVLDPTTHHNIEVNFLESKDKIMQQHKYVGLNAAQPSIALNQKQKNALEVFKQTVENRYGFTQKTATQMAGYIQYLISQGVTRETLAFNITSEGIRISAVNKGGFLFEFPNRGLNAGNGGSGNGIDWENLLKDGSIGDWISDIWGDVEDFFDVEHCNYYNSGWLKPKEAKSRADKDFPFIISQSLAKGVNQKNYDKYLRLCNLYYNKLDKNIKGDWSSCTIKSCEMLLDLLKEFRSKIRKKLTDAGYTFKDTFLNPAVYSMNVQFPGWGKISYSDNIYFQEKIIAPKNETNVDFGDIGSGNNSSNNNGSNNNNNGGFNLGDLIDTVFTGKEKNKGNNQFQVPNEKLKNVQGNTSTAKFGGLGVLAGIALLAYPSIKKAMNENAKKTNTPTKKTNKNATK
ncbi:hypothetical protein [Mesonia aquimarina]|uniref:hypothetical protein n=1 Tax=Mesonia aquimarina TaxID=1504967 RepID=UPI000EF5A1A4|nr:hypothetical protein [Mesonia aquimarina]